MEQWVFFPLLYSGRAADNDDRRLFGESFGSGVRDLEAADTIGNAHDPETPNPRIRIGSKAGALFVASIDDAQFAFRQQIVKAENIIARYAKDMADAMSVELVDEVLADGWRFHSKFNNS